MSYIFPPFPLNDAMRSQYKDIMTMALLFLLQMKLENIIGLKGQFTKIVRTHTPSRYPDLLPFDAPGPPPPSTPASHREAATSPTRRWQ